ncbi:MAG: hypothetical protein WCI18_03950 [Pseudomonadota bacterium]
MSSKDVSASKKSSSLSAASKSRPKASAPKLAAAKKTASPEKVKPAPKSKSSPSLANTEVKASSLQDHGSLAETKAKKSATVKSKQTEQDLRETPEKVASGLQVAKKTEEKADLAPEKKWSSPSEMSSKPSAVDHGRSKTDMSPASPRSIKSDLATGENLGVKLGAKKESPSPNLPGVQTASPGNSGEVSKERNLSNSSLSSSPDSQIPPVSRDNERQMAPPRQNDAGRSSEARNEAQNYNRNGNHRQDRNGQESNFAPSQSSQMKVQGQRNDGSFQNQKQGGNSNFGSFNQDNYLEIKISGSLYRKLKELSRSEGLSVDELACELVTEGCVVRAWELVERKAAMKTHTGNTAHNGSNSGNGRSNPGFNNNNKQNYNPKSKQGRSNYNKIMEDNAHFLEYVRNQEKRQR